MQAQDMSAFGLPGLGRSYCNYGGAAEQGTGDYSPAWQGLEAPGYSTGDTEGDAAQAKRARVADVQPLAIEEECTEQLQAEQRRVAEIGGVQKSQQQCGLFNGEAGSCSYGSSCTFVHLGAAELEKKRDERVRAGQCHQHQNGGNCKKGEACRFSHA